MLKFIFIVLLIANALLFALWQGYFANPVFEPRQPQRLLQQQAAAHLKLISADEATAPIKPDIKEPAKQETFACLEWGTFLTSDINKVEEKLKALAFGNRQSRQNVQDTSTTMVFIPPLGSKEAADKKALELTHLGVHDYFIVQDPASNLRWSISLGVFKSEEAAKQQLAALMAKGVHSAKIGVHAAETNKVNYLFKNVTGSERSDLDNLKTDFPAQDLHLCKAT